MPHKIIKAYKEYCSECRDEQRKPAPLAEWFARLLYYELSEVQEVEKANPLFF